MDVVRLTRQLIDIPSVSGQEAEIARFVADTLTNLGAQVHLQEVEPGRPNVLAVFGDKPSVTLSTHLDTVPGDPVSSEDEANVYGRGACDAKGILAAMVAACERLARTGKSDFGLLAVVGEERGSSGAYAAATWEHDSRYLINGEPTENQLALGSKGALRIALDAEGTAAHSAYPELGHSATDDLLDTLEALRRAEWPSDPLLGDTTFNIGTLHAGTAPNVVPDHARAELLIRLVGDPEPVRDIVRSCLRGATRLEEVLCIPAARFVALEGFEATTVRYTSDAPILCPAWGQPLLIGPGSIHVAHTDREFIAKADLVAATGLYASLVERLLETLE